MTDKPEKKPAQPAHLPYLDSVRGIAAMMVVFFHFITHEYGNYLYGKLAAIVFNGSDAVSFFFVLSGFVLSYKYIVLKHDLDLGKYYVARFFRLWPAFFLTVLINALYLNRDNLSMSGLADLLIFNKTQFWEEASLFRMYPKFYKPSWTLSIELALSFILPFVIVVAQKNAKLLPWFILALFLAGNMSPYLVHFILGVMLSCMYNFVKSGGLKDFKWYKYKNLILALAFLLYSVRHIAKIIHLPPMYYYMFDEYLRLSFFHYTGLASFIMLVALIDSEKAKQFLQHKIFLFFGKISYGLYLMHWLPYVFVYDRMQTLLGYFPGVMTGFVSLLLMYVAVTIILSVILHYTVELPFIRIGKKVAGRMKRGVVIKAEPAS